MKKIRRKCINEVYIDYFTLLIHPQFHQHSWLHFRKQYLIPSSRVLHGINWIMIGTSFDFSHEESIREFEMRYFMINFNIKEGEMWSQRPFSILLESTSTLESISLFRTLQTDNSQKGSSVLFFDFIKTVSLNRLSNSTAPKWLNQISL
jgi:hypothetical protein